MGQRLTTWPLIGVELRHCLLHHTQVQYPNPSIKAHGHLQEGTRDIRDFRPYHVTAHSVVPGGNYSALNDTNRHWNLILKAAKLLKDNDGNVRRAFDAYYAAVGDGSRMNQALDRSSQQEALDFGCRTFTFDDSDKQITSTVNFWDEPPVKDPQIDMISLRTGLNGYKIRFLGVPTQFEADTYFTPSICVEARPYTKLIAEQCDKVGVPTYLTQAYLTKEEFQINAAIITTPAEHAQTLLPKVRTEAGNTFRMWAGRVEHLEGANMREHEAKFRGGYPAPKLKCLTYAHAEELAEELDKAESIPYSVLDCVSYTSMVLDDLVRDLMVGVAYKPPEELYAVVSPLYGQLCMDEVEQHALDTYPATLQGIDDKKGDIVIDEYKATLDTYPSAEFAEKYAKAMGYKDFRAAYDDKGKSVGYYLSDYIIAAEAKLNFEDSSAKNPKRQRVCRSIIFTLC
ncbi:hypothetical protein RJT34_10853 [Clitoria ternatea]|uniref:Uncharacterized protein n=1 Tax=Clitoria ternatea TaxID=43366 RepID=A0AAN9JLC4_CLITE